jgi:hypothetical protein
MSLSSFMTQVKWGPSTGNGIMELAQLNDMFWVRLTQVIAAVIGY